MGELRLEVREYQDETRWRWVLTGAGGALVADHEVRLDRECWQLEAFRDLLGYLRWHAAPDRRAEDEARIVAEVGAWIGAEVLGPVASAMVKARSDAVRVVVPPEARALLFRPLELGHAGGKPLSLQGVTLVMQLGEDGDGAGTAPVGERLRVLGLFSLPEGGQPLNLRRERHALVTLINGIAAGGRAAAVRVLQYGVTRDRLRDVLEEDEGWDVIHISGHGAPGVLLLEKADGSHDLVTAAELADLLELARERVKLVTVSACWSAALTAAEQRRVLGLPIPEGQWAGAEEGPAEGRTENGALAPGTLATELAERLGCAVLAMRYPVVDDFAIALSGKLYDLLAAKSRPLPRALGMALADVMRALDDQAAPALSAGTPTLFGERAAGLRLAAPVQTATESYDTGRLKLAGFPPQPDRFVGRTRVMTAASAALAADSGVPGVLLFGMPGGGKTACAVELAYTHEHAFDRLVWFKAPDEGQDITGTLADFALTLERELPGFQMVHVLADEPSLAGFVPRLTELAEQRRVLIVLDNVESLLSDGGDWRDARWGRVVDALCGHRGLGRMVLTSRRRPTGLAETEAVGGVLVAAVDALSLDEALLLARDLPHLGALIRGELAGVEPEVARRLALGVLNVAQGHPKLLELAEGQAADPERLSVLVNVGDQAWREAGGLPEGFFAEGQSRAGGIRLLPGYRTDVTGLTEDEARALFVLSTPGAQEDLGLGNAARSAVLKVMRAVPAPFRPAATATSQLILVDPERWMRGPEPTGHLGVLQAVVFSGRRLRMRYRSGGGRGTGEATQRIVDPYGLVCKSGIWYLVADQDAEPRLFRVSRVMSAEADEAPVRRRDGVELAKLWQALRRQVEERPATLAVLARVRRDWLGLFRRICAVHLVDGEDDGGGDDPEWAVVRLRFGGVAAARIMLSFGGDVEVVSPPEVRDDLAAVAAATVSRYADGQPVRRRSAGTTGTA